MNNKSIDYKRGILDGRKAAFDEAMAICKNEMERCKYMSKNCTPPGQTKEESKRLWLIRLNCAEEICAGIKWRKLGIKGA